MKNNVAIFSTILWGLQLHCLQYPPTTQCTQSRTTKSHYSRIPICEWLKNSCFCLLVTIAARPGSVGHQKATGQPWQSESALPRCDKSPLLSVVVGHSHEPTTHDHWTSLLQDSQPVTILVLALKYTIARLECYNSYSYITWRIRLSVERWAFKWLFKRCLPL